MRRGFFLGLREGGQEASCCSLPSPEEGDVRVSAPCHHRQDISIHKAVSGDVQEGTRGGC